MLKKRIVLFVVLIFAGFHLLPNGNRITGRVIINVNKKIPIPDAKISVIGNKLPKRITFTSKKGTFNIINLPAGRYEVAASIESLPKKVYIIDICCGKTVELEIDLAHKEIWGSDFDSRWRTCPIIEKRSSAITYCWTRTAFSKLPMK